MTKTDRPAFVQVLTRLAIAARTELGPETAAVYFDVLQDLPLDVIEAAAMHHMRTSVFFPKPAELRPRWVATTAPSLGEIHAELEQAAWKWRPNKPPQVSAAAQEAVRCMGGWRVLTSIDADSRWHRLRAVYEPIRQAIECRAAETTRALGHTPQALLADWTTTEPRQ